MECIYAAMIIHKAGGKVDEDAVTKVLEAAGAKVDGFRIKALVSSLEGVDIDKAIKKVAVVTAAPAPQAKEPDAKKEEAKEKPEAEGKSQDQATKGLDFLFR